VVRAAHTCSRNLYIFSVVGDILFRTQHLLCLVYLDLFVLIKIDLKIHAIMTACPCVECQHVFRCDVVFNLLFHFVHYRSMVTFGMRS